ncbi:MAG: 5'-nucleotidase C-terminal domain-containing protein [Dysgonamonadaceae bacterium]|jgi:2',3'-cyclic-nucleotide 2'-phosphodiesterase (5'-nucleotidase family)|nr:5'-nucleotidase C-terminal domain-containing protein [Dysgonamonadaceae bacterium]
MQHWKKVKKQWRLLSLLGGLSLSCVPHQHYVVKSIADSQVTIDSVWDKKADPKLSDLIESYKAQMDSEMNKVVGTSTQMLTVGFPQSRLSNFTADMMFTISGEIWGDIDFALINVGGLRSSLDQGEITVGELYEIFPFENRMVCLDMPGTAVMELFQSIAFKGGEGLSKNLQLTVKNRNVQSLEIGGKPLDEKKIYRVGTVDYVAEGNDGMIAFRKSINRIDSQETLRNMMIKYIQRLTGNNQEVNAELDNRITILQ